MTPAMTILNILGTPWRVFFAPIYHEEWKLMHQAAIVRHSFFPGGEEYHYLLVKSFYGW